MSIRRIVAFVAVGLLTVFAGCSSANNGTTSIMPESSVRGARTSASRLHPHDSGTSCSQAPAVPGMSQCLVFDDVFPDDIGDADPNNVNACIGSAKHPICYGPAGLRAAYKLTQASQQFGSGVTVAVVDFYNYPNAGSDLDKYRSHFGLPACNGCLTIVNESGSKSPLPPNSPSSPPYSEESALDIQMVSAICPNCNILLVEANSPGSGDAMLSVAVAEGLGAKAISNSYVWGGEPYKASQAGPFANHPGIVITAGAGDSGAGCGINGGQSCTAQEPCSFAGVVCVGGTTLTPNGSARGFSEVVWDGLSASNYCPPFNGNPAAPCATGSGCSSVIAKPAWQTDSGCPRRSESDISADADPNTGVVIFFNGNKRIVGGTSASTPMIAAMFALAGITTGTGPATLWGNGGTSDFFAINSGNNQSAGLNTYLCPSSYTYICSAGAAGSYSGPAGWGTPRGLAAF